MKKLCALIGIAGLASTGLSQVASADATAWVVQMQIQVAGTFIAPSIVELSGTKTGAANGLDANDVPAPPATLNNNAALVLNNIGGTEYKTEYQAPLTTQAGSTLTYALDIFTEGSASSDATGVLNVWNPSSSTGDIPNDSGAAALGQAYSWTIHSGTASGPVVFTFDPNANGTSATPNGTINLGLLPHSQATALHYYLVVAPVPEPGSLHALGAGAISLLGLIRRRTA